MADTESDQSENEQSAPEGDDDAVREPEDKSDTDTYVDRDKIDFDPDDGLLSGTAIKGGTDIPGPHESVDDVTPEDEDGAEDSADGDGSDEESTDDEES